MKHRINGCLINLRTLSDKDIERLIREAGERIDRAAEEIESLAGEKVRRKSHLWLVPDA